MKPQIKVISQGQKRRELVLITESDKKKKSRTFHQTFRHGEWENNDPANDKLTEGIKIE